MYPGTRLDGMGMLGRVRDRSRPVARGYKAEKTAYVCAATTMSKEDAAPVNFTTYNQSE